jgi:hypothetical protein
MSSKILTILIRLFWSYFVPEVYIIPGNRYFRFDGKRGVFHQLLPLGSLSGSRLHLKLQYIRPINLLRAIFPGNTEGQELRYSTKES